jgi:hypothetical protein
MHDTAEQGLISADSDTGIKLSKAERKLGCRTSDFLLVFSYDFPTCRCKGNIISDFKGILCEST